MSEPIQDSTYADIAALFTEAAQRVRECRRPGDIAEALPSIERAYHALRPYFKKADCPIRFLTIALPAKKLRSVVTIEIADPDGLSHLTFYIAAEEKSGNLVPCPNKGERDKLAVLLDRWSRFFAERQRRQTSAFSHLRSALDIVRQRTANNPTRRPRLHISDGQIHLDGEQVDLGVTQEKAAEMLCFLEHLLNAEGGWRTGSDINRCEEEKPNHGLAGARWDRVRKRLPEILRSLTESGGRKGYRLAWNAWHK